jgi:hypothetical protein
VQVLALYLVDAGKDCVEIVGNGEVAGGEAVAASGGEPTARLGLRVVRVSGPVAPSGLQGLVLLCPTP